MPWLISAAVLVLAARLAGDGVVNAAHIFFTDVYANGVPLDPNPATPIVANSAGEVTFFARAFGTGSNLNFTFNQTSGTNSVVPGSASLPFPTTPFPTGTAPYPTGTPNELTFLRTFNGSFTGTLVGSTSGAPTYIAPGQSTSTATQTGHTFSFDVILGNYWLNDTNINNAWGQNANWSFGNPPTILENAIFGINSTYNVDVTADAGANSIYVTSGNVTFNLNGNTLESATTTAISSGASLTLNSGSLTSGSLISTSGTFNHHDGTLTIDGGTYTIPGPLFVLDGNTAAALPELVLNDATTSGFGDIRVGDVRQGSLTVQGGSVLANNSSGTLGNLTGSSGAALITGMNSQWNNALHMRIGLDGHGELTIADGGKVTNTNTYLAFGTDSSGTATVTGAGSLWDNSDFLTIGRGGDATLLIEAGGKVSNTVGDIGTQATVHTNTVTVTGDQSLWENSELRVGHTGIGVLNVQDGGKVTSNSAHVARNGGSSGTVTITGTGSRWENATSINVGNAGTGIVNIQNGGLLKNSTAALLGTSAGVTGTLNVTGAGSTWESLENLTVGYSGTGNLNIQDGGLVMNTIGNLGFNSSSTGTATITGAGSKWQNSDNLIVGGKTLTTSGGTGEVTVTSGGTLEVTGTGTLKLWNAGTLNLEPGGTVKTHDFDLALGTFNFTGGTLSATGAVTGDVIVPDGGVVTGTGTFTNLTVAAGGAVSPGDSPETMSSAITEWEGGGNYLWEINTLFGGGGAAGSDPGWDLWNAGDLTVSATAGDPFNVVLHSLTALNDPGALAGWNASLSHSWLIATADVGIFTDDILSRLAIDDGPFIAFNDLDDGAFSLLSASGGSELLLTFNPFQETGGIGGIPEPAAWLLLVLGLPLLVRRRTCAPHSFRNH